MNLVQFSESQEAATRRVTLMMNSNKAVAWVVYQMKIHGKADGMNAVCEQSEWDEMELARPGYHTLIRGGIMCEGEAERLARGTSGDLRKSGSVKKVS
jgi:hypothetical protein